MSYSSKSVRLTWGVVIALCCAAAFIAVWYRHAGDGDVSLQDEDVAITAADQEPPSEWNTYHGGPTLDGVADTALPEELEVVWRFNADGAVSQTPVSRDGRVFFATDKGHLFAVDMEGKKLWERELTRGKKDDGTPIPEVIDAPLACFGTTVLAASADGTVYAFDTATGEPSWSYDAEGSILGTPNYRHDDDGGGTSVFIVSQDDGVLHSVNGSDGSLIWKTEGVDRCDGSAAVGANAVVYGSCASALHVFSPVDGSSSFDIEIDGDSQVAGGVALVGDEVFSGSRSGKIIHADAAAGKVIWVNEDSEDEVFTTPAVNDETVVFSSGDGNVFALDRATGKQKWMFATEGTPTSPVIARDKVVVASDGTLYVLSLADGSTLWSYDVSDEISSPAVFNNMIVVGSDEGTVTAFGAP
jgi:outer membrane protein assembly factor BamB